METEIENYFIAEVLNTLGNRCFNVRETAEYARAYLRRIEELTIKRGSNLTKEETSDHIVLCCGDYLYDEHIAKEGENFEYRFFCGVSTPETEVGRQKRIRLDFLNYERARELIENKYKEQKVHRDLGDRTTVYLVNGACIVISEEKIGFSGDKKNGLEIKTIVLASEDSKKLESIVKSLNLPISID
ncbi:MAG: hypothetical protein WC533_04060 [Candidatus Pacearchaeota archaeon]